MPHREQVEATAKAKEMGLLVRMKNNPHVPTRLFMLAAQSSAPSRRASCCAVPIASRYERGAEAAGAGGRASASVRRLLLGCCALTDDGRRARPSVLGRVHCSGAYSRCRLLASLPTSKNFSGFSTV